MKRAKADNILKIIRKTTIFMIVVFLILGCENKTETARQAEKIKFAEDYNDISDFSAGRYGGIHNYIREENRVIREKYLSAFSLTASAGISNLQSVLEKITSDNEGNFRMKTLDGNAFPLYPENIDISYIEKLPFKKLPIKISSGKEKLNSNFRVKLPGNMTGTVLSYYSGDTEQIGTLIIYDKDSNVADMLDIAYYCEGGNFAAVETLINTSGEVSVKSVPAAEMPVITERVFSINAEKKFEEQKITQTREVPFKETADLEGFQYTNGLDYEQSSLMGLSKFGNYSFNLDYIADLPGKFKNAVISYRDVNTKEMFKLLVTYGEKGNILDHLYIAYDAQDKKYKIDSFIDAGNKITVEYFDNDLPEPRKLTAEYTVSAEGVFNVGDKEKVNDFLIKNAPVKELPAAINIENVNSRISSFRPSAWQINFLKAKKTVYMDFPEDFRIVYRVKLSDNYETLVLRDNAEMQTKVFLANFDKDNNVIDVLEIAYGDFVESYQNSSSVIYKNEIVTRWSDEGGFMAEPDGEAKHFTKKGMLVFAADSDGAFKKLGIAQAKAVPFAETADINDLKTDYELHPEVQARELGLLRFGNHSYNVDYALSLSDDFYSIVVSYKDDAKKSAYKVLVNYKEENSIVTVLDYLYIAYSLEDGKYTAVGNIEKNKITVGYSDGAGNAGKAGKSPKYKAVYTVDGDGVFDVNDPAKTNEYFMSILPVKELPAQADGYGLIREYNNFAVSKWQKKYMGITEEFPEDFSILCAVKNSGGKKKLILRKDGTGPARYFIAEFDNRYKASGIISEITRGNFAGQKFDADDGDN